MKKMISNPRISEFTSYMYIKDELKLLGWDTRNPNRNIQGEVYTQQECLDNEEIHLYLGKQRPEYTIKVQEDSFYIIEAKPKPEQIDKAYTEAMEYANEINKSNIISAPFISGVAGNDEDGYIVKSGFYEDGVFKTINYHSKDITSLLSKELSKEVLKNGTSNIPDLVVPEYRMLQVAEQINEVLHTGSIFKDERASVISALLLSMIGETLPNYNDSPKVFINDINIRAKEVLLSYGKQAFYEYIEIKLPNEKDAQIKYKNALSKTMFLLMKIDIKAAMNSGNDILGKFYEVFLKYGNGAKDIGIVLTPRHITKFATSVLRVNCNDIIYDPACGTGGFLVAAYDYVRKNSTAEQLEKFKNYRIFGVEQQSRTALLAIVNMIFRGDGHNNIINNNCLTQSLICYTKENEHTAKFISITDTNEKEQRQKSTKHPVTKVLMNPPFALKDKDEKEYKFVEHALKQMDDGGLLFAILPISVMTKSGSYLSWRKNEFIEHNTLLSVVTFPEDLFYPVGVNTCGIFVKKGYKHPDNKRVLWIKICHDGLLKSKGKRLPYLEEKDQLSEVEQLISSFIQDDSIKINNIPQFMKACAIDMNDKNLELIPEAYLDTEVPTIDAINKCIESQMREYVAYLIRNKKE